MDPWDLFLLPFCKDEHPSPTVRMVQYKLGNTMATGKDYPKEDTSMNGLSLRRELSKDLTTKMKLLA